MRFGRHPESWEGAEATLLGAAVGLAPLLLLLLHRLRLCGIRIMCVLLLARLPPRLRLR
jgi:hypothetical protein